MFRKEFARSIYTSEIKCAQLTELLLLQADSQATPFAVPHRSHCVQVEVARVTGAVKALSQSVNQVLRQPAPHKACCLSSTQSCEVQPL